MVDLVQIPHPQNIYTHTYIHTYRYIHTHIYTCVCVCKIEHTSRKHGRKAFFIFYFAKDRPCTLKIYSPSKKKKKKNK